MGAYQPINTIKKLLNVEDEMNFLNKLNVEELERLTVYIRDRIENPPKDANRR
jgi:hypothetical protein